MASPLTGTKFLEVQTPVTTDGITLKYDQNRQPMFKTTFLPITAKRELERNAARLPVHLRPIITAKDGDTAEATAPQEPAKPKVQKPVQNDKAD